MSHPVTAIPRPRSADRPAPASVERAVYTVAEVAELLALSLGSTYAMVRAGQIPAKRMGGRWVIPRRRFHAWLDGPAEASNDDAETEPSAPARSEP